MNIVNMLKQRAMAVKGRIVLPESGDERTLRAAAQILSEGIAQVILIGKPETVNARARALNLDIVKAQIIEPAEHPRIDEFAQYFHEKRKEKGLTLDQAHATVRTELYFGALLVKFELADGMVAGAANTTADVLRAALQVVGVLPGLKTVSSAFIMVVPDYMGEDRVYLFADCAVVPNPTSEQLADIAVSTAYTRKSIIGDAPKVALLSFSTKGSGDHEMVDKVRTAVGLLEQRKVDFEFDGEMQLDAAIVPEIGRSKAPNSKVAGIANTLIFPDLQSGNIGYKLVQRFAKAEAIGPIIQGLAAPICDLSRGCSAEDIVNTSVLVLLMV
ncbi:MAG: phosphate acetyltransferase [Candidatus Cloacimonadaceae bacterium]|nr:phosphate acetyltransferase [Candidatus Cloacimonadaceae bacterium]